jgi:hypothetical protein
VSVGNGILGFHDLVELFPFKDVLYVLNVEAWRRAALKMAILIYTVRKTKVVDNVSPVPAPTSCFRGHETDNTELGKTVHHRKKRVKPQRSTST